MISVNACHDSVNYFAPEPNDCCCFEIVADNYQQSVCGFEATITDANGDTVVDDCPECEASPSGWNRTVDPSGTMHWSYIGPPSGSIGVNQTQIFKFCRHSADNVINPWHYHLCPQFCVTLPDGNIGVDPETDEACCRSGDFNFQCIYTNDVKGTSNAEVTLVSVFPNPTSSGYVRFSYAATASGSLHIIIYSNDGKQIDEADYQYQSGNNNFYVNTQSLSNGSYNCVLTFGGKSVTERFVVTK